MTSILFRFVQAASSSLLSVVDTSHPHGCQRDEMQKHIQIWPTFPNECQLQCSGPHICAYRVFASRWSFRRYRNRTDGLLFMIFRLSEMFKRYSWLPCSSFLSKLPAVLYFFLRYLTPTLSSKRWNQKAHTHPENCGFGVEGVWGRILLQKSRKSWLWDQYLSKSIKWTFGTS